MIDRRVIPLPETRAFFGPIVNGRPQWEVRRVGGEWVLTFEGGPVEQTWPTAHAAVTFARSWADEVAERRGG